MKTNPLILEIKGNSLDDGPGIRSVVFFKGCPLDCVWCHNPESKNRAVEISFDAGECIGCDSCISACPSDALSRKNEFFIDRDRCTLCFSCAEVCPSGALSRIGRSVPADEVIKDVIKDKPFFDTSGGGVTVSGGEPTINMAYTSELLKGLKNEGISVLVETCGFFNYDSFMELIYPYADMIYYDIKIIDSETHRKFCGVPNETILSNFIRLHEENKNGGAEVFPRTPLIPDITDTEENITGIADFYRSNGVTKAALLSYNPLWHEKNLKIGITNPYSDEEKMSSWLTREKEQACRKIFNEAGVEVL